MKKFKHAWRYMKFRVVFFINCILWIITIIYIYLFFYLVELDNHYAQYILIGLVLITDLSYFLELKRAWKAAQFFSPRVLKFGKQRNW